MSVICCGRVRDVRAFYTGRGDFWNGLTAERIDVGSFDQFTPNGNP